jgi:putative adhesin
MTTTLIRRAAVLALIAASTTALTGCAGVIGAKMTYDDTEKGKITDIVLTGGSGDVTVTAGEVTETSIRRVIRRSSNPGSPYRLDGTTLNIDTSCGANCSVSYEIKTPAGVNVRGREHSGDVVLKGVGVTDIELTSGDVSVSGATGAVAIRATSGDIQVTDAKSSVKVHTTSGDVEATRVAGPADLKVTSGDMHVELTAPNSVTAQSTSGDIWVEVPASSYRVTTHSGSGDEKLEGLTSDATSKNVIDVRVTSGDITVASTS